jgi:hypothetical protein
LKKNAEKENLVYRPDSFDLERDPNRIELNDEQENVCPYLGLLEDPDTPRSYPSQWNRCFHVKPIAPVALEHQYGYCLSPVYSECEVYKGELVTSLPNNIKGDQYQDKKWKKNLIRIGVTLSVLVLVGLLVWPDSSHGLLGFFGGGFSTSTPTSVNMIQTTPPSVKGRPHSLLGDLLRLLFPLRKLPPLP